VIRRRSSKTAIAAAEQIEDAQAEVRASQPLAEIIADQGYHSNQTMIDLAARRPAVLRPRSPDRGRRDWSKEPQAQIPVYANRRRLRGARGRRLMRQRGERISNAPSRISTTPVGCVARICAGHTNILKRLADSCGRLQSRARHAPPDRQRHAARAAGSHGDRHSRALGVLGRSPTPAGRDSSHGTHSRPLCAGCPSPITITGNSSAATTYTTGC